MLSDRAEYILIFKKEKHSTLRTFNLNYKFDRLIKISLGLQYTHS